MSFGALLMPSNVGQVRSASTSVGCVIGFCAQARLPVLAPPEVRTPSAAAAASSEVHAAHYDACMAFRAVSMKAHEVEPVAREQHAVLRDGEGKDALVLDGPVGVSGLKRRQDIVSDGT